MMLLRKSINFYEISNYVRINYLKAKAEKDLYQTRSWNHLMIRPAILSIPGQSGN
jgi:hypothetical protein